MTTQELENNNKLAYKFIMQMKNITAKYLLPGQICLFSYNDPKTKSQLEYWDKNPLTLFFGTFRTQNGDIREIGLNLHYYPPYARKQILVKVYETFKSYFEKCFNSPTHKPNALMDYRTLKHIISSDAKIAFGVKEYVPSLFNTFSNGSTIFDFIVPVVQPTIAP